MKNYSKSDCKKQKRKTGLFQFILVLTFIFVTAMGNAQNCYCNEQNAKTIGSDVGVETVSEALSLGLLVNNTTGLSTKDVCIKGELTVDQLYRFINYRVNLYTDAKIIVESYKELGISGGTELFGCDNMWHSVLVKTQATLKVRNATIEDGITAIDANSVSNLYVANASFFNNRVGIRASSKVSNAYSLIHQLGALSKNIFRTVPEGALKPPHAGQNGYAGIEVENLAGFTIGGTTSGGNTFWGLENGIVANHSIIAVHNSGLLIGLGMAAPVSHLANDQFGNGILLINSSAIIDQCSFDQNTVGVHAIESNVEVTNCLLNETIGTGVRVSNTVNGNIIIDNNDFDCFFNGIELLNLEQTSVSIQNNSINMLDEEQGPPFNPIPFDALRAIDMDGCVFSDAHPCLVSNNTIDLNDAFEGIRLLNCDGVDIISNPAININNLNFNFFNLDRVIGIHIFGGGNHTIEDNRINGPGAGATLGGNDSVVAGILSSMSSGNTYCSNDLRNIQFGQRFEGPHGGTTYQNNEFNLHSTAFHMDTEGVIGPQLDAGNLWNFASSDVGARHESGNDFAENSRFVVPSFGLPNTPVHPIGIDPNPQTTMIEWFIDQGGTPLICTDPFNGNADSLDLLIAGGNVNSGTSYSGTTNWELERYLFNKLTEHPTIRQQYPSLATFYNSHVNATLGNFHQVRENIIDLSKSPSGEVQLYRDNLDSLSVKLQELIVNDSLLENANPTDSALLVAQRQIITSEMAAWANENDSLLAFIWAYRTGRAQQYLAQNAAIQATAVYETNEKTVNDVYLNTAAQGVYSLTPQQKTDLEAIVWQCPKLGGTPVYRARSLYRMASDTLFNDAVHCAPPQQIAGSQTELQQNQQAGMLKLFPNPAAQEVTLLLADELAIDKIKLVHLNGQIVAQHPIAIDVKRFTFPIGHLPNGMYYIEIMDGNHTVHTEKLMIVR